LDKEYQERKNLIREKNETVVLLQEAEKKITKLENVIDG
jgi:hypothetical protein